MKEINGMDLYEFCRWSALLEAIDLIDDQCDKQNISFNETDLKPLAIQKFIDNTSEEIQRRVENELKVVVDNKFKISKEMID